jgi:recombinational DNA repair protein RecT
MAGEILVPVYSEQVEAGLSILRGMDKQLKQLVSDDTQLKRIRDGLKEVCRLADKNKDIARSFVEAPDSWEDWVNRTAQARLNPLPNFREVWAVPRWDKHGWNALTKKQGRMALTWQPGYMSGIIAINRTGMYYQPTVHLWYENCEFEHNPAGRDPIVHHPWYSRGEQEPGALKGGYLIAYPKEGGPPFHHVCTVEDFEKAKEFTKTDKGYSPVWTYHYEAMAKKTIVFRATQFVQLRTEDAEWVHRAYVEHETGYGVEKVDIVDPTEPPRQGLQRTVKHPEPDPEADQYEAFNKKMDEEGL